MKRAIIAALAAVQIGAAASPARASEVPVGEPAPREQRDLAAARIVQVAELGLGEDRSGAALAAASEASEAEDARRDEPRKKRKSTGDKVLTGAAVVLGIGALAVGGLLVAIFVN